MREGALEALDDHDHRWRLRFVRDLPHPPTKVWRALTDPVHLAAWFPTEINGDRATGAALEFVFPKGEAPPFDGEMLAYEPVTLLELRWGEEILRFELEPRDDGTRLTFLDTFDELGKAARDATGWHTCLDLLECDLDGEEAGADVRSRWDEVHPIYVARFGPEAATIDPPAARRSRTS